MRILRQEIIANRNTHLYIYGDDKTGRAERGQAEVCVRQPNCFPIWTRAWSCSSPNAQFQNIISPETYASILEEYCFMPIRLAKLRQPDRIIVVFPRIGRGCSNLRLAAPNYYKVIKDFLDSIK